MTIFDIFFLFFTADSIGPLAFLYTIAKCEPKVVILSLLLQVSKYFLFRLVIQSIRLCVLEEKIELHIFGQSNPYIVLFDKSCVETACFSDLLLDKIVPHTHDSKVIHYFSVHSHNWDADRLFW